MSRVRRQPAEPTLVLLVDTSGNGPDRVLVSGRLTEVEVEPAYTVQATNGEGVSVLRWTVAATIETDAMPEELARLILSGDVSGEASS